MRTPAMMAIGVLLTGSGGAALADGHGKAIYEQTCVACHGADGKGAIPGTPDFTKKGGPLAKPDDVLFKNTKNGFQTPGSPMAMPPKGGNPHLKDDDIKAVLWYLRKTFGS